VQPPAELPNWRKAALQFNSTIIRHDNCIDREREKREARNDGRSIQIESLAS